MKTVLNVLVNIIACIAEMINNIFNGVEDWCLNKVLMNHKNRLRCAWHGVRIRRSMEEYRQDSQDLWRLICNLGLLAYPLAYAIGWFVAKVVDNERIMHVILRILIVGMIIYSLIDPLKVLWWQNADAILFAIPVLLINYAIFFNPIRLLIVVIILDFDQYFSEFMEEDVDDWKLEKERRRGKLDEYDEN